MPSLHLGLTPWVGDLSGGAHLIAEQAELAEAMGYQSIWLPESHFLDRGACPSPLLPLAAAAARTSSIKLATTSYLLPVRHPVQVAEEVAVLDRISQGRVILGLGRGFRRALFDVFDIPIKEKRALFEANLDTILRAWAGEPISSNGTETITLAPLPVQSPHPPLWLAAFGPKAVTQAGRLGFPYLASPIEPYDRLVGNYSLHRETLRHYGHDDSIAVPLMRTVFVSKNRDSLAIARVALEHQAAELAKSPAVAFRRSENVRLEDWALVGYPDEVADAVERYRENLGMTHLIVRGHIPQVEGSELRGSLEILAGLEL